MVRNSVMKRSGRDAVAQLFDGENGFVGVLARDEVFGLQLGAAGGGEVHAEVRHALVPRARDTLLLSAGRGVVSGDGVELLGGEVAP